MLLTIVPLILTFIVPPVSNLTPHNSECRLGHILPWIQISGKHVICQHIMHIYHDISNHDNHDNTQQETSILSLYMGKATKLRFSVFIMLSTRNTSFCWSNFLVFLVQFSQNKITTYIRSE